MGEKPLDKSNKKAADEDPTIAQQPDGGAPKNTTQKGDGYSVTQQDDATQVVHPVRPGSKTVAEPLITKLDDPAASRFQKKETPLPDRISRYETISLLGEGSFGLVVKSHDPKLDRKVAVKIQKITAFGSSPRIDRFAREARAAAQLRHPNIIPVFEYGEFAENHFIVYQFVQGHTLRQWAIEKQADIRQKVAIVAQIADALDYAHTCGIVHRDIKPANILVDDHDRPHIADFGCARREQGEETQTVDGAMMGTPAYMSPEAAAGRANLADGRTDIWSLGVILFELLSGERPFRGKLSEILYAVQHDPAKRLRQVDRSLPVDLETICDTCLQQDPEKRFSTAAELAADLRRWLDGVPIKSRRTSVVVRSWKWAKRNRAVASLLSVVAIILVMATIASVIYSSILQNKQNDLVDSQLDSLETASPDSLAMIIGNLETLGAGVSERLKSSLSEPVTSPRALARYQLAAYRLVKSNGSDNSRLVRSIAEYLPDASPGELTVMVELLKSELAKQSDFFWNIANDVNENTNRRLRSGCVLAQVDSTDPRWKSASAFVISDLLDQDSQSLKTWTTMLRPVAAELKPELELIFESREAGTRERAAEILGGLFFDDPDYLCELGERGEPNQLKQLIVGLENNRLLALEQLRLRKKELVDHESISESTNIDLMLAHLGDTSALRQRMEHSDDLTLQTALIHHSALAGISVDLFRDQVTNHHQVSANQLVAAIASLGQYDERQLYLIQRRAISEKLVEIFKENPDSGVHSMSEWLLKHWGFEDELKNARSDVQTAKPRDGFDWHEDPNGLCFAIFGPVEKFEMGRPDIETETFELGKHQTVSIPYRFGVATREITAREFLDFEDRLVEKWNQYGDQPNEDQADDWQKKINRLRRNQIDRKVEISDSPMSKVKWHEVALFCNDLTDDFESEDDVRKVYNVEFGKIEFTVRPFGSIRDTPAIRLPTGTEWEYACRAGTSTKYFFGRQPKWMKDYGWNINNSGDNLMPVATLKPNRFGIFDTHGNVMEWCHNSLETSDQKFVPEIRDQGADEAPSDMSVYKRRQRARDIKLRTLGFRVARTYPD